MTPQFLRTLQAQILASAACQPHIQTNEMPKITAAEARAKDGAIAAILSESRKRLRSRLITERGIIGLLGPGDDEGEGFIQKLEAFGATNLPAEHPLKTKQAGIRRILSWLKSDDGVELGEAGTQTLLLALGQTGVVPMAQAQAIAELGLEDDPVTIEQVSRAVRGPWGDEEN
jgi:hypothetical protein